MAGRRLTEDEQERYDLVPRSVTSKAKVVPVRYVPPGFVGITIGNRIMLRKGHEQKEQLLAHELVHVRQFHQLGTVRFFVRYLTEYAKGIVKLRNTHEAYRAISLEVEARQDASRWAKAVGRVDDDALKHRDEDG
jgi:hypothetical protein